MATNNALLKLFLTMLFMVSASLVKVTVGAPLNGESTNNNNQQDVGEVAGTGELRHHQRSPTAPPSSTNGDGGMDAANFHHMLLHHELLQPSPHYTAAGVYRRLEWPTGPQEQRLLQRPLGSSGDVEEYMDHSALYAPAEYLDRTRDAPLQDNDYMNAIDAISLAGYNPSLPTSKRSTLSSLRLSAPSSSSNKIGGLGRSLSNSRLLGGGTRSLLKNNNLYAMRNQGNEETNGFNSPSNNFGSGTRSLGSLSPSLNSNLDDSPASPQRSLVNLSDVPDVDNVHNNDDTLIDQNINDSVNDGDDESYHFSSPSSSSSLSRGLSSSLLGRGRGLLGGGRGLIGGLGGGSSPSRGRNLSLSIDASMQVLRQALLFKSALMKHQEQMSRARQNQEILQNIGKRSIPDSANSKIRK